MSLQISFDTKNIGKGPNTYHKTNINKNDNIQKNEVQYIRWSDEYWQV